MESGSQWKDGLCCDFTKNKYRTGGSIYESPIETGTTVRGWRGWGSYIYSLGEARAKENIERKEALLYILVFWTSRPFLKSHATEFDVCLVLMSIPWYFRSYTVQTFPPARVSHWEQYWYFEQDNSFGIPSLHSLNVCCNLPSWSLEEKPRYFQMPLGIWYCLSSLTFQSGTISDQMAELHLCWAKHILVRTRKQSEWWTRVVLRTIFIKMTCGVC